MKFRLVFSEVEVVQLLKYSSVVCEVDLAIVLQFGIQLFSQVVYSSYTVV